MENKGAFGWKESTREELRADSIRGSVISISTQIAKLLLQIGGLAVLARLLAPDDFGLVAMVAVFTNFLIIFGDLGLSVATIQHKDLTSSKLSALLIFNVLAGLILSLLTAGIAPLLVWFYRQPELLSLTQALGLSFLLRSLGIQHLAILKREMRYGALAALEISSTLVGTLVGIWAALSGWGYWSLVALQLTTPLVSSLVAWPTVRLDLAKPAPWNEIKAVVKFGGNLTAFSFLNYFNRNADKFLIGRVLGSEILGYYSRAYSLLLLPLAQIVTPVGHVAVPGLSRLQERPEEYRSYYLRSVMIIAYVAFPLSLINVLFAEEIILLFLGRQWDSVVPIYRALAVSVLFQPIGATVGWVYTSLDQTRRMLLWSLFATPVILLSVGIGLLLGGAQGVALAYSCCILLLAYPQLAYCFAKAPVSPTDFLKQLVGPLLLSVATFLPVAIIFVALPGSSIVTRVTIALVFGGTGALFAFYLSRTVRTDLNYLASLTRQLRPVREA